MLVGLGLKLVSATRLRSYGWVAGCRAAGVLGRVAGWARPVSYTLGPEAGWQVAGWAGPRHVRHASRRAEGLGLRLVLRGAG